MLNNDPLELSPRRSFAAWSEIVRGTAMRWSSAELATARAFGNALVGIIVQINAVRVLIADQHLAQVRAVVAASNEPVLIVDAQGEVLFANEVFLALSRRKPTARLGQVSALFSQAEEVEEVLSALRSERQSWKGELELRHGDDASTRAVAVRADVVPARDGTVMGFFMLVDDLTELKRAMAARAHLEASISLVKEKSGADAQSSGSALSDGLMSAILANASLAAMDITDAGTAPSAVPMLRDLELSTQRATALYQRIRDFTQPRK